MSGVGILVDHQHVRHRTQLNKFEFLNLLAAVLPDRFGGPGFEGIQYDTLSVWGHREGVFFIR